jgi:hypothetical protein
MRTVAHLLAMVLLVPQTLIFAAAALLDHVAATGTFFGFLSSALDTLDLMFGWGGFAVFVVTVLVAGCGFSNRWRPVASLLVLVFDIYTAAYVLMWFQVSTVGDSVFFLLPGTLAVLLCVLIIRQDVTRGRLSGVPA